MSRMPVQLRTTFEFKLNFRGLFFVSRSCRLNITAKLSPPAMIRALIVNIIRGFPEKFSRLFEKREKPALQNADIE
jgi:hypothetical protein